MADSPYVVDVTAESFQSVVLEGSRRQPVLVDFWAAWCGPCKVLTPVLEQLAEVYGGNFLLAKINTEEEQGLAAQFGIRSIPTCKLFKDGQAVDEFVGALPEGDIRTFLDRHIPRESDALVAQAQEHLRAGNADTAKSLIDKALALDPGHSAVILAQAQWQAITGDPQAAASTLESLPPDEQEKPEVKALRSQLMFDAVAAAAPQTPELEQVLAQDPANSEARYQLAARRVMEDDLDGALEQLLTLMQKDRRYGDDAARKALVQIFDLLGDDPRVPRYRSRMMNLLY
ncbi:MAG: thioredoxin [Pseudomonadota bacterium]